jgi:glycosyltransferase involved in cell wall biosynthesis
LSKETITVGLLISKYKGGGVPMEGIIRGLNPQRYRVICIYLNKTSDKPNRLEQKGYKAYYISRKEYFQLFNLASVWKLSSILRQEKVDILHCQRHQSTVYGSIAAKLAKTPVVLSHVHGLNRSKRIRRKLTNCVVLRWVNKIIAVSQKTKEDIIKNNPCVRPDQVECLNNSIDYKRFADISISKQQAKESIGLNNDSFVFGAVGRLVPTKGLTYLLRAFAKVYRQVPKSNLILIGEGRLKQQLVATAAELGVDKSVYFLGYRTDVEKLLRAMDVFVMSSVAEGMPGVLLEAMAAGLPCIATSVGGIPTVLEDGKLGMLVPAENADALAEAMVQLAQKPDLTSMVREAQRKVADNYSNDAVRPKLEKIYEETLARIG